MSTPDFLEVNLIERVQAMGFGEMDNFTLHPAHSDADVPKGETVIMEVIDRNGQSLYFTGSGLTIPGQGFFPYKDIQHADWPSRPDQSFFQYADWPYLPGRRFFQNKNIARADWTCFARKAAYEEFIMIVFYDCPPVVFHVGVEASIKLGALIRMMSGIRNKQDHE